MRPATWPPIRYARKSPRTTGTAGARSFVPPRTCASSVPIAGASSAIAPIDAIHPPSTAPHAVPAGRTSAVRAISSPSHIVGLGTQSPLNSGARRRPSRRPCRELSERCLCPCGLREFFGEVRALPGKFRAAEVTVRRRREIDRPAQREPIDDGLRTEIEMLLDELADELVAHLARPERLHVERDRTRAADGRADHSLADVVAEPLVLDAGVVLRRDDHRVDAPGHAFGVLDGDLALPVRPQVRERTALAGLRELARDVVRERDRERHELGRLADREAEHHPLIAGAELLGIDPFARLDRLVHALRDLRRLLLDRGDDAAGPVVEAVIGVRVPDLG